MTLHCDVMIAAAPLPLRSYAAAALRSVKQSPALPDPLPLVHTNKEQSANPANPAAADLTASAAAATAGTTSTTAASPDSPIAWTADPCPLADAAAAAGCSAADSEWTAADDDHEMGAEELAIDQCDFEWPGDEADDIDLADDSDCSSDWSSEWSSDWSRMERLADSLHSAPAAGHSRKSRRAPPHSRTSAAALRAATSHSGALSAACAKAASRPWTHSSHGPQPQLQDQLPVARTSGILPSPFAQQEAHEKQAERERMRQLQREAALRSENRNTAPSGVPSAAPAVPAPSAPAPRKGELRAAVTAARKLPLHLHRCDNPRWAAVLQARAATKQHTARRQAVAQRPPQMVKQQQRQRKSKHAAKIDQTAARADAAAATRKQRREEQTTKRQLHLKLRREADSLPAVQSIDITATLVVTLAVARWSAANPPTIAAANSHSDDQLPTAIRGSQQRPLGFAPSRPLSAFEQFRRRWYYAHRARIESALPGAAVVAVRLADPAAPVQSAFMALQRRPGEPTPALTFHGTRLENLASILRHGFLRPGQTPKTGCTVRVANGSAFGLGVYSSTTADYSVGYCRGGTSMLVCATLLGHAGATAAANGPNGTTGLDGRFGPVSIHRNIVVAFDPRRIVPLFHLDFDMRRRTGSTTGSASTPVPVPAPAPVPVPSPGAAANQRKRDLAVARKAAQRRPPTVTATATAIPSPQRRFLRDLLCALHSQQARAGRQLKRTQLRSTDSVH